MKVTAALPWWDEPAELLYECVTAVCRAVADDVVALDGAYARYPDGTPASPKEQAEAVKDAARDAGATARVIVPDRLWAGQCEKRTVLMNAAADSDWIATVDADWLVQAERDHTRYHLERARGDALCFTVSHEMLDGPAVPTTWAAQAVGHPEPVPHLWRSSAAPFVVERHHWWVKAQAHAGTRWLWGGDGEMAGATFPWTEPYRILHRAMQRDELRAKRNRAFCNDRVAVLAATGQEDDRPDLPRPVFDFVSRLV